MFNFLGGLGCLPEGKTTNKDENCAKEFINLATETSENTRATVLQYSCWSTFPYITNEHIGNCHCKQFFLYYNFFAKSNTRDTFKELPLSFMIDLQFSFCSLGYTFDHKMSSFIWETGQRDLTIWVSYVRGFAVSSIYTYLITYVTAVPGLRFLVSSILLCG